MTFAALLLSLSSLLTGQWQFYKMIYEGQELPPRDPRLLLRFDFKESGADRLYWTLDEGKTFCERKGRFTYDGEILEDEVTWVNPDNEPTCSSDPDMQPGRKTTSSARVVEGDFRLEIPLGGESLTYVWKRIELVI